MSNIDQKCNRHMKFKAILIVCLMCSMVCCNSNTSRVSAQDSPEWLTLSMEAQEKIVNDYVDALDEFAQVMPKFGQDTEAQWAADTVRSMALDLKQNKYPFTKSLAIISQMQNYTGYGMAYFNATIGLYKEPHLAAFALDIIRANDSVYNELQQKQFEDIRLLSHYRIISINNMQLFNSLNRVNNEKPIDNEFRFTLFCLGKLDEMMKKDEYSEKEIFKISSVLESYSYFQMICPLLMLFSGSKGKYDSNIDVITDAAMYIDSQSTPVFQALDEGKKIKVMSDPEFEAWMITTTQHKVKLLNLLTKFIREWNPSE